MGIDYVVDYDCEPKRALGLDGIIALLKDRSRALAALQLLRERGAVTVPIDQIEFEFVARTPEGDMAPRRVRVKDVLDRASRLEEFAPACTGCPANNTGRAYGCVGSIGYPVSRTGEAWLLERIRPGPGADLLRELQTRLDLEGGEIAKMRAVTGTFFEATQPARRDDLGFAVGTDGLFEVIFCKGHLAPPHASVVLIVLSALRIEKPVPEQDSLPAGTAMLIARHDDGSESAQLFDMPGPADEDDDTVRELKAFFRALFLARGFGVRLLIDY